MLKLRRLFSFRKEEPTAYSSWLCRELRELRDQVAFLKAERPEVVVYREPEWQPIETAPVDGTRILFLGCNGVFESSIHPCIPAGAYMGDGWQEDADVTHWMPLPEPPG